jgi:hypothetical protein
MCLAIFVIPWNGEPFVTDCTCVVCDVLSILHDRDSDQLVEDILLTESNSFGLDFSGLYIVSLTYVYSINCAGRLYTQKAITSLVEDHSLGGTM